MNWVTFPWPWPKVMAVILIKKNLLVCTMSGTHSSNHYWTCLLLLILMLWHRQQFSNRKEKSCLPLLNAGFEAGKSETPNHPLYSPSHAHCLNKFWRYSVVNFWGHYFFPNFGCDFSFSHSIGRLLGMVGCPIDVKWELHRLGTRLTSLTSPMTLTLDFWRSYFEIAASTWSRLSNWWSD